MRIKSAWTSMTSIRFAVLIILSKAISHGREYSCSHITTKCSCSYEDEEEHSLYVTCKGNYNLDEIRALPLRNVTKIALRNGWENETIAILKLLRNESQLLKRVTIAGGTLQRLQLEWLPDKTELLTISRTGLKEISSEDCEKNGDRLLMMESVFLSTSSHPVNLTCFPKSVSKLTINNIPIGGAIKWPNSLEYLKVAGNPAGTVAKDKFRNVSKRLRIFWLSRFIAKDGIMLDLPEASNMTSVSIQYSNISTIRPHAFRNTNVTSLNLGGNKLQSLTSSLPRSLKRLFLYSNAFEKVPDYQWMGSALTWLDLSRNKLKSVPLGLPRTLKSLILRRNIIDTCSPEAFVQLPDLEELDLSLNKLTAMPTGIRTGLISYNIASNEISQIPGPQAYSFCGKCNSFSFGSNDWSCDGKFFVFLMWIMNSAQESVRRVIRHGVSGRLGRCTSLSKDAFELSYLESVSNYVDYISTPPFANCTYEPRNILKCTDMDLEHVPKSPPPGLLEVEINKNKKLTEIPDYVFFQQSSLDRLTLKANSLKRIPYGLPPSLTVLDMRRNNITELSERDVEAFTNLTNLRGLFLYDNHIKTLLSTDFKPLPSLELLGIDGNDLVCDCSLQSFSVWYMNLQSLDDPTRILQYQSCQSPKEVVGRDIRLLSHHFHYELKCVPPQCIWNHVSTEPILNCSIATQEDPELTFLFEKPEPTIGRLPIIPTNAFWQTITLDGLQLTDENIELAHLTRLRRVDLSNNQLSKVPLAGLPSTVENLNLRNNTISHLPTQQEMRQYLPDIQRIDLRDNIMKTLSVSEQGMLFMINSFLLSGNPLICDCSLTALISWVKLNATDTPFEQDGMELVCAGPPELSQLHLYKISESKVCPVKIPFDFKIIAIVICFIAILALLLFLYIRARKRKMYKKNIMDAFQKLLQQESSFEKAKNHETEENDNTNFFYAAFVATDENNQDGDFLDELIQELEIKRGRKLCVNCRDFSPGADVADNVVESIRSSKRVILLVSKSFTASPWCQYGVQVAMAELHQRQKKLIVPINLEKCNENNASPHGIRTFLSLIPSFDAPSKHSSKRDRDKFWDSIEQAIAH